jgi:glycosyltransferase involved in cell wall biosynthesis
MLLELPIIEPISVVTIAAVIPAYNEEASLKATMDSLLTQTRPPDAIFIMVNNCTDDTLYVANEYRGSHDISHRGTTYRCEVTAVDMGENADKKSRRAQCWLASSPRFHLHTRGGRRHCS